MSEIRQWEIPEVETQYKVSYIDLLEWNERDQYSNSHNIYIKTLQEIYITMIKTVRNCLRLNTMLKRPKFASKRDQPKNTKNVTRFGEK